MLIFLTLLNGKSIWVSPSNIASMVERDTGTEIDLFTGEIRVKETPSQIQFLLASVDVAYTRLEANGGRGISPTDLIQMAQGNLGDPNKTQ